MEDYRELAKDTRNFFLTVPKLNIRLHNLYDAKEHAAAEKELLTNYIGTEYAMLIG